MANPSARYKFARSPLEKLAARSEIIVLEAFDKNGQPACYADFRDGLRLDLARIILEAQRIEAERCACPLRALEIEREIKALV